MLNMKVLIIDDNIYKTIDIKKALEFSGIKTIISKGNQGEGLELIVESLKDSSIDLIITDMQYPLAKYQDIDNEAGFKLIEKLRNLNINIPVIICSQINYTDKNILGCVWYNELNDINFAFKELIEKLKGEKENVI